MVQSLVWDRLLQPSWPSFIGWRQSWDSSPNNRIHVKRSSEVKWSESRNFFATPLTVAHQVPLSMGFFRQEHWSGLPLPSPGDLPNPGIKPPSPALQVDSLPSEPPGKRKFSILGANCKGTRRAEMVNWDAEIPHQELLPPVGLEGWRENACYQSPEAQPV